MMISLLDKNFTQNLQKYFEAGNNDWKILSFLWILHFLEI